MSAVEDPIGPLQGSAVAAHTLYESYKGAGFTDAAALYLTVVVVAVVSQRSMEVQALQAAANPPQAPAMGPQQLLFVCLECSKPLMMVDGQMTCLDHPEVGGVWRFVDPAERDLGLPVLRCAVCQGPLVEWNGQLVCPNHPPPHLPPMGKLGGLGG